MSRDPALSPDRTCSRTTWFAQLTAPGQGALATIAVWGGEAESIIERWFRSRAGRPLADFPLHRVVYGYWTVEDDPGEDLIIVRLPHAVEIHAHASSAGLLRITRSLTESGAVGVTLSEYLQHRNEQDFWKTECEQALMGATTRRAVKYLLQQLEQLPRAMRQIEPLRTRASSDDRDHDALQRPQFATPTAPRDDRVPSWREEIERMLAWSPFGLHLTRPWNVVLCGRPNVGKSSLTNALCGFQRAIVHDRAGTTRDRLTQRTAIDGWPVLLSDTAGLRLDTDDSIEQEGVELARQAIEQADVVVTIFDLSQPWTAQDQALYELVCDCPHRLTVFNKSDIPDQLTGTLPSSVAFLASDAIRMSALTGARLGELLDRISQRLVPQLPPAGQPFPVTVAQVHRLEELLDEGLDL